MVRVHILFWGLCWIRTEVRALSLRLHRWMLRLNLTFVWWIFAILNVIINLLILISCLNYNFIRFLNLLFFIYICLFVLFLSFCFYLTFHFFSTLLYYFQHLWFCSNLRKFRLLRFNYFLLFLFILGIFLFLRSHIKLKNLRLYYLLT